MPEQTTKELPPVNHEMVTLARESRGWTQMQAAKLLGIHQARLSRIESDLTPVDEELLGKMAEVFRYLPEFLDRKSVG